MASEGVLYWRFSLNGQYTCQTGYRFLKEEDSLSPLGLAELREKEFQRSVWALQTPNILKNKI